MIISVTGTPGTGKTAVAGELAGILSYEYVDLNSLASEKGMVIGRDKQRDSKIVDEEKLSLLEVKDNSVVDGHLSQYVKCDVIVVLRTRPDLLKERLSKRDWLPRKVKENVEAEILGVCSYEAFETGKRVIEFDTSEKDARRSAKIIKTLVLKNKPSEEIDWLEEYDFMLER